MEGFGADLAAVSRGSGSSCTVDGEETAAEQAEEQAEQFAVDRVKVEDREYFEDRDYD